MFSKFTKFSARSKLTIFQSRHNRTFSEDERLQAQNNVKKTETEEDDDISEDEDPMMLAREAKDWKVSNVTFILVGQFLTPSRARITTPFWA